MLPARVCKTRAPMRLSLGLSGWYRPIGAVRYAAARPPSPGGGFGGVFPLSGLASNEARVTASLNLLQSTTRGLAGSDCSSAASQRLGPCFLPLPPPPSFRPGEAIMGQRGRRSSSERIRPSSIVHT